MKASRESVRNRPRKQHEREREQQNQKHLSRSGGGGSGTNVLILKMFGISSIIGMILVFNSRFLPSSVAYDPYDIAIATTTTTSTSTSTSSTEHKQLRMTTPVDTDNHQHRHSDSNSLSLSLSLQQRPTKCTREELLQVRKQLDPEVCPTARTNPFRQLCSITVATKCVDATWLDEYYAELQQERSIMDPFLGISIGCNKGFDALNALRMGTFDAGFDKSTWQQAMEIDGAKLHHSVCGQDGTQQFPAVDSNQQQRRRGGEMHCFEPMPVTYNKLKNSAESLGYDKKGFKVVHGAVSNTNGKALFMTKSMKGNMKGGVENVGLNNCAIMTPEVQKIYCEEVDVFTLQEYMAKHVDTTDGGNDRIIHNLSIDVEGYDGDVILGAGPEVLKRVEYLEFEYNWMGSWKNQHLHDMVTMLDNDAGFTCYWAGEGHLWRITDCWMRYYDIHTWANVACVNRQLVPRLASKMEAVFQKTLTENGDKKYQHPNGSRWIGGSADDVMLLTEPHEELISTEYL